jgi:flavin-dependent dehydrogenase
MGDDLLQIVGAGPSGLSAALAARARGMAVTVYEKRSDVGARFHGDFQGLENWTSRTDVLAELEQRGIDASFTHKPVYEIVCMCIDGPAHTLRADEPIFYLVRRGREDGTLDQALKSQALDAGVTIRFGERKRHLTNGGVIAEGPHRADVIAAGYVFETDMADGCYVVVADKLAPVGYSYLLIDRGRGTVATCLFRNFHDERKYLDATIDFFEREAGLRWNKAKRFGGSGNFQRIERTVVGNRCYVGEAAGFQDALFGFGLRSALTSGALAGQSEAGGSRYNRSWRYSLGGLNASSLCNRWIYERLGDHGRKWVFRRAIAGRDPRGLLQKLYAPARWKTAAARWLPRARKLAYEDTREECNCTWCRCARNSRTATGEHT